MQVILKEKIRGLGNLGDLVDVKPGFARNFLVPQAKALRATKANMTQFEAERAELEKQEAARLSAAQSKAAQLEEMVITISSKAGDGGKLFGSIGTRDVADAITAQGVEIEKQHIRMPNGVIRELGEFSIDVHLHTDVDVAIQLVVEAA